MEEVNFWVLGCLLIFAILVFVFIIPIVIARWIFRINEQIDLLTQIKDELKNMKNLLIILLLLLGGCTPHWYNSNKTLEEATKECRECDYDASMADFKADLLRYYSFEACMKAKGYLLIDEEYLPPDFQKANVIRQSRVTFPLVRLGTTDSNFIRIAGK